MKNQKEKNQKEKKQKKQISQEELLKAITALEEIVMAKMPKEWEEEEEVAEEEKAKNKIRKKLMENDGELTRSNLYRAVRGDRMGSATFSMALQSLEDNREIAIVKKDTGGRPVEKINLLRGDIIS